MLVTVHAGTYWHSHYSAPVWMQLRRQRRGGRCGCSCVDSAGEQQHRRPADWDVSRHTKPGRTLGVPVELQTDAGSLCIAQTALLPP
jgi:hypothetical protein